jgi:transposase
MDEHRIGLKPLCRRQWAAPRCRPTLWVEHRYEWLYVYGFVHPPSGRTFWLLMPTVSILAFSAALHAFMTFAQADSAAEIRLLVDQAGWHTSPQVDLPDSLRLWFLPPYSPELQPAEHLWSLTDQPLINRHFDSLDHLESVQGERCNWLQDHPDLVRSATCFHWWPSYA